MRFMIPILFGIVAAIIMNIADVELFSVRGFIIGVPFWTLGALICEAVKDV